MNTTFQNIPEGKKIFVASDFHLGAPNHEESLIREKKIIRWLDSISQEAYGIILAGDVFDFWFEYRHVVPKGFTRFLGKLAELSDSGVQIIIFVGNHDLWMADYLTQEINATIYRHPVSFMIGKQKVLIGHGDGLGPGDRKFKLIKRVFTLKLNQWLFSWLHPDIGLWLGEKWSSHSRAKDLKNPDPYLGEKEPLFQYCLEIEQSTPHNFYLFGHRHLSLNLKINETATYINLGDWIKYCTYVEMDNDTTKLKTYES